MDTLMTPVLYVDDGTDFKEDQCPTNGSEYIRSVIAEREKCSETVTAKIDRSKFKKQNIFIKEPPVTKSAPLSLQPSFEWQMLQVADFSDLRMYIHKLYNDKTKWEKTIKLPSIETASKQIWKEFFDQQKPYLRVVFAMKQPVLEHCLEILVESLDYAPPGNSLSAPLGEWLYAILVCLRLPLTAETCSTLRDFARKCSYIRSNLNEMDTASIESASPLNLFICLVSRYFRQVDLAD